MAKRLSLIGAAVEATDNGFEVWNFTGDDGYPTSRVADVVYVTLADGHRYSLPNLIGQPSWISEEGDTYFVGPCRVRYHDVKAAAEAVRRHGSIDPDLWIDQGFAKDDPTFEERMMEAYEAERYERFQETGSIF